MFVLDHTGVGNPQLIKEDPNMAKRYNNRSVAEQNSLELSWGLLMEDDFEELQKVICPTNDELKHFRELVVNSVMAVRSTVFVLNALLLFLLYRFIYSSQ